MTNHRASYDRWVEWAIIALTVVIIGMSSTRAEPSAAEFQLHKTPRPVAEIAFENAQGKALSLSDFLGKTVLVNIWATWCGPCRREMPTLDRLQAQLGGASFEVLALSIDRAGQKPVEKFYRDVGIQNLALYIDASGKSTRALGVIGLPTTLLIDRRGREIGRLVGPAEWDAPSMVAFIRTHIQ